MRFQLLMAASMKMTAFWDIVPCTIVSEVHTAFIITMMMEALCTSEMSVYFYEITWCYISEGFTFCVSYPKELLNFETADSEQRILKC
jgi:hypothetical protein